MPLAEKGVRGKGRQPLSPPSAGETRSAISAPSDGRLFDNRQMHGDLKVGDWVRSYSMGIRRVWRVLSGFNEMRFSLDAPKLPSSRTLLFSHRLVNNPHGRGRSLKSAPKPAWSAEFPRI